MSARRPVRTVAAVDLGAESGRVVRVDFDGAHLDSRESAGSRIRPRSTGSCAGTSPPDPKAHPRRPRHARTASIPVARVGVDGWGVDYGLMDATAASSTCRPATATGGNCRRSTRRWPRSAGTGSIGPPASSSSRSTPCTRSCPTPARRPAREGGRLLMMPDVFHHLLSGSRVTEYSAASTTGLYDMAGTPGPPGCRRAGRPDPMLPEVVAGHGPGAVPARSATARFPARASSPGRARHRQRRRRDPPRARDAVTSPRAPGHWWASRSRPV